MNYVSLGIILFLVIIIVCVYFFGKETSNLSPEELTPALQAQGWTKKKRVSEDSSECKLYMTFSTQTEIIESLNPITDLIEQCNDGFHHFLASFERTCLLDQCIGKNGRYYNLNEQEFFYDECSNLDDCEKRPSAVVGTFKIRNGNLTTDNSCLNSASSTGASECYMSTSQFFIVDYLPYVGTLPYYNFRKGNERFIGEDNKLSEASLQLVRIRISGTNLALDENGNFTNYETKRTLGFSFLINEKFDFSQSVYFAPQLIKRSSYESIMNTIGRLSFTQNLFNYSVDYEIKNSPTAENFARSLNVRVGSLYCGSQGRLEYYSRPQLRRKVIEWSGYEPDYILDAFVDGLTNGSDKLTCCANSSCNSYYLGYGNTQGRVISWDFSTLKSNILNWKLNFNNELETIIIHDNRIEHGVFSPCTNTGPAFTENIVESPPCKNNIGIVSNLNFYNLIQE